MGVRLGAVGLGGLGNVELELYDEMLAGHDLDAVNIVTPHTLHHEQTCEEREVHEAVRADWSFRSGRPDCLGLEALRVPFRAD